MTDKMIEKLVTAALYDFGGWLTTRKQALTVSETHNASPMAEALAEFCALRGLASTGEIPVETWQDAILLRAHTKVKPPETEVPACFMKLLHAAQGLSHGTDWNSGTHAKLHGCRNKLLRAKDECEHFLRAPAKEAVAPDNGWKCKTCGRGQDAFHWGCDTEGWDRPAAHTDNDGDLLPSNPDDLGAMRSERVRQALSDAGFRLQDDYFLAHGASLMSEDSHEIIHSDTVDAIVSAAITAEKREG